MFKNSWRVKFSEIGGETKPIKVIDCNTGSQRISELENVNKKLRSDILILESENRTLNNALSDEREQVKVILFQLAKERNALQTKLENEIQEKYKIQEKSADAYKTLAQKAAQLVKEKLETRENLDKEMQEKTKLQNELIEAKNCNQELMEKLNLALSEKTKLQHINDQTVETKKLLEIKNFELKKLYDTQRKTNENLQLENENLKNEVQNCLEDSKKREMSIHQLFEQQFEKKKLEIEKELFDKAEETFALKKHVEELEEKFKKSKKILKNEILNLKEQLALRNVENSRLKINCEFFKNESQTLKEKYLENSTQNNDLTSKLMQFKNKVDKLKNEKTILETKLAKTLSNHENLKKWATYVEIETDIEQAISKSKLDENAYESTIKSMNSQVHEIYQKYIDMRNYVSRMSKKKRKSCRNSNQVQNKPTAPHNKEKSEENWSSNIPCCLEEIENMEIDYAIFEKPF